MIELVVFDMAGTTIDDGNAVQACLRAAMSAAGVDASPSAVDAVMGLPKPRAIQILLDQHGLTADVDPIHNDFTRRMQSFYSSDPSVRPVSGAEAVFVSLRQAGIKVALDTGFFRPIVNVLLNRLGWVSGMTHDADVTSDEVEQGRPHPDMVRHLMARLGVTNPSRVAKVGDTQADMEEGTNAGCGLVIGVLTGSSSREQLQTYPHTHIVESVTDVPSIIKGLANGR